MDIPYHLAWTLGSASHWTNFHDASRFWVFLKTARLEPPTKEDESCLAGIFATLYLSLNPAPPTFSTADIIHGPEMNIGTLPLAKSGSVVGVAGADLLAIPSVKKDW